MSRKAIFASSAGYVFLQDDAVAVFDIPPLGRLCADPLDSPDNFVPEDDRRLEALKARTIERRPVDAAHAGELDPQQSGVLVGLRDRQFAHLDLAGAGDNRCPGFHSHTLHHVCFQIRNCRTGISWSLLTSNTFLRAIFS